MRSAFAPSEAITARDERVWLIGAIVALAAAFLPTLLSFHDVWMEQPYTHGYLVLLAVAWLAWRERKRLVPAAGIWSAPLPAAVAVSLLWLVAHVTSVRALEQAAAVLLLLLWVAVSLGRTTAVRVAPLVGILLLAVPVWEVLTPVLQALTVAATGAVVGLLRIPASIEGNVVHIPSGSFLIEGGCAGLNYFMAALVIGAVYAQAFLRAWPARLGAVGLLAGMAVVGNWLRVSSLIVIGHATEMQSGLMDGHLTFGWAIFAVALVVFFPFTKRLEAWESRRWPAAEGARSGAEAAPPATGSDRRRAIALATAAVVSGPLVYFALDLLPPREVPPHAIGSPAAWVADARAARPFAWKPAFPGADRESTAAFTSGGDRVVLDHLVYDSRRHDTELIGFSSRIAPDSAIVVERLFGQIGPDRRLVNEAVVREGDGHVLVWYWYRVGGIETQSAVRAKALELWAFLTRATTSELIAISAPCAPGDCSDAARSLASFLGA